MSCSVLAQTKTPDFVPNVVDAAQMLTPAEIVQVNRVVEEIKKESGIFSAVLTVDSLGAETVEEMANRVFKDWKLGKIGLDNGLLILISKSGRKVKIETGYGLEGDLPDVVCKRTLTEIFIPYMRSGQTKDAIIETLKTLSKIRSKQSLPAVSSGLGAEPFNEKESRIYAYLIWFLYGLMIFLIWPSYAAIRNHKLRRWLPHLAEIEQSRFNTVINTNSKYTEKFATGFFNKGSLFLKIFLLINPGLFVYNIAFGLYFLQLSFVLPALLLITLTIIYLILKKKIEALETIEGTRKYITTLMRDRRFTPYSSDTSSGGGSSYSGESSSSSGFDSGGSSSSSGGGSSGGGGASSGW